MLTLEEEFAREKVTNMETIHIKVPIEIRKALRIRSAELGITMTQLAGEIFAEYFLKEIKKANV